MGTDALQVRRNGDFYYPIYFEDGFEKLADAIRTEGLENRNLYCNRYECGTALCGRGTESSFTSSFQNICVYI